jgi:hypothetical protein
MARTEFRSERHAALDAYAPPDVDRLLQTGAMAGPYRRTQPLTLTWRARLVRALRAVALNFTSPIR